MRITRPLKLTAAAALTSVVASLAVTGPLAASALAAPKPKAPLPSVTATVSSVDSSPLGSRTASSTAHFAWSPIAGQSYTCFLDGGSKSSCTTSADYSGIPSGTHSFTIKVGKYSTFRPNTYVYSWQVDRTPPSSPPAVDPLPSPTRSTTANVTFTKVDQSTASFLCALDDSVPAHATACSSPWPLSSLAEQSHTAYVYAVDDLGNVNTTAGHVTWVVDHTAPNSPTVSVTPVGPTSSTDATISWIDGDAVTFTCALDDNAPTACTTPWPLHNLAEGTHVVAVTGTDAAGNAGTPGKVHWIVDQTPPPAPIISTGPAATTDSTMASFQFGDADAGATFECKLDSDSVTGSYAPCTSPKSYLGPLADGNYQFSVRATDAAGNGGSASSWTWTVDTVNPTVTPPQIFTGPAPLTHDVNPAFTFQSLDDPNATFLCAVDPVSPSNQAAYATCASGDAFAVSVDGGHTLYVEEVSGGVTSLPSSWNWTLDSSPPPAPTFNAKPDSFSNATGALFNFSDTEANVSYVCQLDAQTPFACATPANVTQLGEGLHTFTVAATDAAGNTSAGSVASYSWTVDLTPPATPTVTVADPSGTTATLGLSDSDSDVTGYLCKLDGSVPASCDESPSFSDLSGGSHTVLVQAVDHAGNLSLPQAKTWTVDPGAPNAPSFDSAPGSLINTHSGHFAFSDDSTGDSHTVVTSFDCYLDNVKYVAGCTSTDFTGVPSGTMDVTGLNEGDHTLTVVGLNSLHNGTPASYPFTVDVTAPSISVTGLPGAGDLVNSTAVTTSVSDNDTHSSGAYVCSLTGPNGFSSTDCSGASGLADGAYTFTADTTDLAGNAAATYSRSWTVDATAPVLHLSGLPAQGAVVNATSFLPVLSTTDAHSSGSYTCALEGSPVSCADLGSLGEGVHTFTADTSDQAGNAAATLTRSFTVDRTAPATPNVTGTSGTVNTAIASFSYGDTSGDVAFYTCSLDGATAIACPSSFPGLGDGAHTLDVKATDAAGNVSAARSAGWVVDTGVPTGSISAPATLTGAAVVTWSEPVSGLDASKVTLTETDSGKAVPATIACRSGSAAASCSGTTSSLTLTPSKRLVPGQHYTVSVAAGAVQDVASNSSALSSRSFRAQRTLQETTAPVSVTWRSVKAKPAFGHRYATEHLAGSQATWAFRGRAITWWTVTGPTQGKARVFVDGKRKGTVNNYAAATHYRVARTFKKLGAGRHVLTIRVLGVKGRKIGKGTAVAIDGFTVGKKRTASPRLTTSWHRVAGSVFYRRHAVVANLAGETIRLTFRGTSIAWTTVRNKTQGKAAVYVDGVRKATVDNYSKLSLTKVRRVVRGLTDSVHTVRIVVLGKHHKGGKGNNVTVDRFVIG